MLAGLRFDLPVGQDRWTATGAAAFTAIPMWGESAPETISQASGTLTSTVPLMRMVTRLDVALDTSVAGLTNRFKLRSVALYNTNSEGA